MTLLIATLKIDVMFVRNCLTQLILSVSSCVIIIIVNQLLLLMYYLSIQGQFIEACKTGNVGVVQKLLECGADPNQTDDEVRSLISAVQYNYSNV